MPTPVTEIVVLSFHPDSEIANTMKEFFSILARQPGFLSGYWGRWVENQDKIQLVVEWDDILSHANFGNSGPDFAALGALILPLVTSPPQVHHVHFSPPLSTILSASPSSSVTEIVTFYSPVPSFEDDIKGFSQVPGKAKGLKGVCKGAVVEEKENAYQFFAEWESLEAHEEAMKGEDIKAKVHLVAQAAERIEMHHVFFHVT